MRRGASLVALVVVALVMGMLFGGVFRSPVADIAAREEPPPAAQQDPQQLAELREFAGKLETLFQTVADTVSPAVVAIEAERTEQVPVREFRSPFDDLFRGPFFDSRPFRRQPQRQQERTRRSLGSGVILDQEGHVLTNNHVVAGADGLTVKLADGRSFKAEIAGTDEKTELAIIKLQGDLGNLPTVALGDSDNVRTGQWVIAIGNPFGLRHTVSAGIVSATGRSGLGVAEYESMIQTDAAVNPGNSGGPLVNLYCEVIGINTAIVGSGGNLGIGFAIPINMATDILDDLIAGREVVRGYLGVDIADLTPEMAKQFAFAGTSGVLVHEVREDSVADKAGFQAGDIITEYDGRAVDNMNELRRRVAATQPGTKAKVNVWRDGKERTLTVEVGNLAEATETARDWLGLEVQTLTPEMARRMGRADLQGVLVADVAEDSSARRYLEPGDVILSVDRQRVTSVEQYRRLVAEAVSKGSVLLRVFDADTGRARFLLVSR